MPRADRAREALLDLDGQAVLVDDEGHVARFSVRRNQFVSAGKLVEDFWLAVDRMLKLRKE